MDYFSPASLSTGAHPLLETGLPYFFLALFFYHTALGGGKGFRITTFSQPSSSCKDSETKCFYFLRRVPAHREYPGVPFDHLCCASYISVIEVPFITLQIFNQKKKKRSLKIFQLRAASYLSFPDKRK